MAKKSKGKYKQLIQTHKTKKSESSEFNPDYSDVVKDLRRIGILAGTFIVILVGLSFVIK